MRVAPYRGRCLAPITRHEPAYHWAGRTDPNSATMAEIFPGRTDRAAEHTRSWRRIWLCVRAGTGWVKPRVSNATAKALDQTFGTSGRSICRSAAKQRLPASLRHATHTSHCIRPRRTIPLYLRASNQTREFWKHQRHDRTVAVLVTTRALPEEPNIATKSLVFQTASASITGRRRAPGNRGSSGQRKTAVRRT